MKYRPDVDGLRACAVSAVILFHAFPDVVPGGFVGVDIFFVISGYLITGPILAEMQDGAFSLANFYQRRIRRIFPALIVVLAATMYVGLYVLLQNELLSLAKNVIASTLFSANLMLLSETNYFDISAHSKPLLHLWSLGIEEQFYLAWPLLLMWLPRRRLLVGIIIGIVASFALNIVLMESHPAAAFFLPLTRAWELLAGALLDLVPRPGKWTKQLVALLGAAAVAASLMWFDAKTPFPGWAAALPVLGTCLLILSEGSVLNRILAFRPIVGIGLISYPMYLWHWPILVFLQIHLFRPLLPEEAMWAIAATVVLAAATYVVVERPIRRRRLALPLAAAMACVGGLAILPANGYAPALPLAISAMVNVPPNGVGWRVHECMLLDQDKGDFGTCIDNKRPLLAVWGDSTASALIPAFRDLQKRYQFGLAQFTVSSCHPLMVQAHANTPHCLGKNAEIVELIRSAQPDIVLLHAIWDVNDSVEKTKPTIDALRAAGVRRIIILGPEPVWPGGLPNAVATYYKRSQSVIPERTSMFVDQVSGDQLMHQIADALGVEYISSRDVFCKESECQTRIGDRLVQSDLVHLTKAGSDFLVTSIEPKLGLARLPGSGEHEAGH